MQKEKSIIHFLARLSCIYFAAVLVIILIFPIFLRTKGGSRISCHSNLKQLSTACAMYAEDYDGYFPRAADWMDASYPYVQRMKTYKCPTLEEKHPDSFGYAYNERVDNPVTKANKKWFDRFASTTPLLFDGVSGARNSHAHDNSAFALRHYNFGNVAYFDGHVKRVDTLDFTVH